VAALEDGGGTERRKDEDWRAGQRGHIFWSLGLRVAPDHRDALLQAGAGIAASRRTSFTIRHGPPSPRASVSRLRRASP